jgi:membrane-associated phospholipid phosphatase
VLRVRRFLEQRLDPSTFLGLHLTLGLIVAAGAVWLFASLLDGVLDNALLVRFDQFADRMIHSQTTPAGLTIFTFITRLGSPVAMAIVAVIGVVYLLLRGWPTLLVTWIAAFVGGGLLERVLKGVVHRSRPPYGTQFLNGTSFSFPSGHAMGSIIGCGMVLYVLFVSRQITGRMKTLFASVAAVFVILVGASRIYLGVHYPSDVLGGWAAGAAWLAACISVAGVALHRRGFSLSIENRN